MSGAYSMNYFAHVHSLNDQKSEEHRTLDTTL